jgi:hypothetical protein
MTSLLNELKNIVSDNCITVLFNTHRTKPDNEKDVLTLKNLLKDAEERIVGMNDKRAAAKLTESLKALADQIDHSHNLDSMVLFVSETVAQFVRLPIAVKERVVIGNSFATRDIVRALHSEASYYILVLSQHQARLLLAFNDRLVTEVSSSFPINNTVSASSGRGEQNANRQANVLAEFFNRVDKELNAERHTNRYPVLICSDESNRFEFMKMADHPHIFFEDHLNGNRNDDKAHAIVSDAWPLVSQRIQSNNEARKSELKQAVGKQRFLSDTNEIWQAIKQGRIQTLFIETDLFQPAVIDNGVISYVDQHTNSTLQVIDDIYDELIEANMEHGGDVVFLASGELADFNGFGAITRY